MKGTIALGFQVMFAWGRHHVKMLSALLTLCEGNPPVSGGFSSERVSNVELKCLFCYHPDTAERIVKLPVISDAMTPMSYQCKGALGLGGNVRNVFPDTDFKENRKLAIPACITARAPRTCRDACRSRQPAMSGKTFPAFPAHAQPAISKLRIW